MPEISPVRDQTGEAKGDTIRGKEQQLAAAAKEKLTRAVDAVNEIYTLGGKREVVTAKADKAKALIAEVYNGELDSIKALRRNQ